MSDFVFFFKMLGATVMALFTAISSIGSVVTDDVAMIAHRGYSGKYPENTSLAFEMAGRHGSAGAETDIRRTKDGVYVTSHNSEIEFCDGTTAIVEENDFLFLRSKALKNKKTKDSVYLTTLEEYCEIMKKWDMWCFVELKGEYTDEQIKEIFTIVENTYRLDKCILQSFSFENLLKARELFPSLPLMLTYGSDDEGYEKCFDYGISIDCNINQLSEEMINSFHSRGLLVAAYTANNLFQKCYAKSFDLDFLESDYYA